MALKNLFTLNPLRDVRRGVGCFSRVGLRCLLIATLALLPAIAQKADAAFVSLKEAEMDAIFGQPSFGADPVDIRYLPTIFHDDANLLDIDNGSKLSTLFGLYNSATIHYAYYVDTIDYCGGTTLTGIVGCGDRPGDDYVIESGYASGPNGAELMAHELAHNLNLTHHPAPNNDNLMDPVVGNAPGPPTTTNLTESQVATILSHPSIQTDVLGKYLLVQPVLLTPEPSTLVLGLGVLGITVFRRRRSIG